MNNHDGFLFTASTSALQHLSNILRAISSVGGKCLVTVNEKGLFFNINELNVCRVQLNLDSRFFDSFEFNGANNGNTEEEEEQQGRNANVRFVLDTTSLLESVTMVNLYNIGGPQQQDQQQQQQGNMNTRTNCIFSYKGYGNPFVLSFEDELMLERVELKTFNLEQSDEEQEDDEEDEYFNIDNDKIILEMILQGSILFDILKDLKEIQTEELYIYCDTFQPERPNLVFISKGELGYSKLIYPRQRRLLEDLHVYKMVNRGSEGDRTSITEPRVHDGYSLPKDDEYSYVETHSDSLTSFYNFKFVSKLLRAAKLATKSKFKKDSNGLTSIILLINEEGRTKSGLVNATIEFKLLELVNELANENNSSKDLTTTTTTIEANDRDANNNFNNKFVENLVQDNEVSELEIVVDDQQKLDDLVFMRGNGNNNHTAQDQNNNNNNNNTILTDGMFL